MGESCVSFAIHRAWPMFSGKGFLMKFIGPFKGPLRQVLSKGMAISSIQMRILKAEVEKDSMRLAIGHCVSRSSGQGYPAHASFASSLNVDPTWALHVEVMKFKQ